jgi:hypothetical protein
MSDTTTFNPHKEEDEGYLAAEAGRGLGENIYPYGTIRYDHWRRGWRIRDAEIRRGIKLGHGQGQEDEGYLAAGAGVRLAENPYPAGTLRYEDWRRGWCSKNDETQRAVRLNRPTVQASLGGEV